MSEPTEPTQVSPIELVIVQGMIEGGHINYTGLLKLRTALTDEQNVLGWHPTLFETREAVLRLVESEIERLRAVLAEYEASRIEDELDPGDGEA